MTTTTTAPRISLAFASALALAAALAGCGSDDTAHSTPIGAGDRPTPASSEATDMATTQWPVTKTDAEWRAQLTDMQYYVTRQKGTERAGTGEYADNKTPGVYTCVGCGQPLYDSSTKFDSGTGWPSFWEPIDGGIARQAQRGWFGTQTELLCSRCGAHLGHVFDDGPPPTGMRHCINSAALKLVPRDE